VTGIGYNVAKVERALGKASPRRRLAMRASASVIAAVSLLP
jgi:hypothetical protein